MSDWDGLEAVGDQQRKLVHRGQIRPGDAGRWILVTREKGIAASAGVGARWSVDHLIIDQDAVPTLAEVKRGSNEEIRRAIVEQLLEYAARASETWSAKELRGMFERQSEARGRDAEAELATLLQTDGDHDVDEFWEAVSTNLAAKGLRLLFVADFIPDPLAREVEFLNAQMPNIEVLAVEIKRFDDTSAQTLVPRVIGRTRGPGPGQRLTRESFLDGFEDAAVGGVAEPLLDAAAQPHGDNHYRSSGVSIWAKCSAWRQPITVAWLYPQPGKKWMSTEEFSFGTVVLDSALPEELRAMLERWLDDVSVDSFVEDVSSKGVKAWTVRYEAGVQHQDVLVERLRRIISEQASL